MLGFKKMKSLHIFMAGLFLFSVCNLVWAEDSTGFHFNNLSLSPFVNLDYTYDSNVNYDNNGAESDSILRVNPGVDFSYTGNEWGLKGSGWYSYEKYVDDGRLDAKRYGEHVEFYKETANGWKFVLGEHYLKSNQNDSLTDGGEGKWRDRDEFGVNAAVSYQMTERTSLTLSGMYSDMRYSRDPDQYYDLYGWTEWSTGLELAHRITEKSNVLLNGQYQRYSSDGATQVSSDSTGYSLMAGLGSAATRRISYHALTGVSWFDYANSDQLCGWTYSLDASWIISKKWAATLAGSSYYQPSESEENQAQKVDALSAGVTYRPMRKLTTRFDVAWRREDEEYNLSQVQAETRDLVSTRARVDYQLMRYMTVYSSLEYQKELSDEYDSDEFNRFRGSVGLSLRY